MRRRFLFGVGVLSVGASPFASRAKIQQAVGVGRTGAAAGRRGRLYKRQKCGVPGASAAVFTGSLTASLASVVR